MAEVFLKSMKSVRCGFGIEGVRRIHMGEERGVALRVWDASNREGSVHADGPEAREIEALVEGASRSASTGAACLVPRLPVERAFVEDRDEAPQWNEETVREATQGIITAFSRKPQRSATLLEGRIEVGRGRTWIANSRGGEVSFPNNVGALVLIVRKTRDDISLRREGSTVSTIRYTVPLLDPGDLDPMRIADEASWRAAASIGGGPVSEKDVSLVLEPKAAARWLRTLTPFLVAGRPGARETGRVEDGQSRAGCGKVGRPGEVPPGSPVSGDDAALLGASFRIVDDLERIYGERICGFFDGEGRRVVTRVLVDDCRVISQCVDSRDPRAPDGDLGPMRRDSFRDIPTAGPMSLCVSSEEPSNLRTRDELLVKLDRGMFVTDLSPLSPPGAADLAAEVKGIWIERGRARRAVAETLLIMPALTGLNRIVGLGGDAEIDVDGPPVLAPSLVVEGANLVAL